MQAVCPAQSCHSCTTIWCSTPHYSHAVAQASGPGAVVKDMAQVALAALATDLGPRHEGDGVVRYLGHGICSHRATSAQLALYSDDGSPYIHG